MSRWVAPGLVVRDDIVASISTASRSPEDQHFYSERYIHGEITRPSDVMAIVHSHSPDRGAVHISSANFVPVLHNAPSSAPTCRISIRSHQIGDTDMLVNRMERGVEVARVLGDHTVVLIRGHGDTVVGPNLRTWSGARITPK